MISIHALLTESDYQDKFSIPPAKKISIHALLTESDVTVLGVQHRIGISIHALLTESDDRQRPARPDCQDFYPRSPCGERRAEQSGNKVNHNFYPRSPCGERPFLSGSIKFCSVFLSTLSLRRATAYVLFCLCWCWISIHALLAESDSRQGIQ